MTPRRLLLLLMALSLGACSTREPTNPLDPDNPDTGGRPRWLVALADREAVDLAWSVPRFDDLDSVRVVLVGGEAGSGPDLPLWSGPAGSASLRDDAAPNGTLRRYRIDLHLAGGNTIRLPEELAEPGPQVPFALDVAGGRLFRLTPDGRRVRSVGPAPDASAVRVDPEDATVLVVGRFAGSVRLLDPAGELLWRNDDFASPWTALRVEEGWWIADPVADLITLLDDRGAVVHTDGSFVFPVEFAAADSGRVWVAGGRGPVALYDRTLGVLAQYEGIDDPGGLAADGAGGVWAADLAGDRLVRLDAAADSIAGAGGLADAVSLAADPVLPGGVWAIDRRLGRVLLLDGSGAERVALEGLAAPSSVTVSPDGGTIWVADVGEGRVVRFARNGTRLSESERLGSPVTISVAFDPAF